MGYVPPKPPALFRTDATAGYVASVSTETVVRLGNTDFLYDSAPALEDIDWLELEIQDAEYKAGLRDTPAQWPVRRQVRSHFDPRLLNPMTR